MEYRRYENTVYIRPDIGEDIIEQLRIVASTENISVASINGIGAIDKLSVGVYNIVDKEYKEFHYNGVFEILSLTGNITLKDGKPYIHAHICACDGEGKIIGGHLSSAIISATGEITVQINNGVLNRKFDEKTGLNLWQFI